MARHGKHFDVSASMKVAAQRGIFCEKQAVAGVSVCLTRAWSLRWLSTQGDAEKARGSHYVLSRTTPWDCFALTSQRVPVPICISHNASQHKDYAFHW